MITLRHFKRPDSARQIQVLCQRCAELRPETLVELTPQIIRNSDRCQVCYATNWSTIALKQKLVELSSHARAFYVPDELLAPALAGRARQMLAFTTNEKTRDELTQLCASVGYGVESWELLDATNDDQHDDCARCYLGTTHTMRQHYSSIALRQVWGSLSSEHTSDDLVVLAAVEQRIVDLRRQRLTTSSTTYLARKS